MPASRLESACTPNAAAAPLSLYIHWPFCVSKCPYCDFNSHIAGKLDEAAWLRSMCAELEHMARIAAETLSTDNLRLETIFFGGGTPSLMPPKIVSALINKAGTLFSFANNIEITAEANPNSAEMKQMKSFHSAGINRLSLGIQSLHNEGLAFLGRAHSVDEACNALEQALTLFDRVSADLIYGLPEQTAAEWQQQLTQIIGFGIQHLSAYQLTIEPGTVFHSRTRAGAILTAEPDHVADLYELTEDIAAAAGLPAYEVSNYAAASNQARHNLTYWQSGNWIAVGPGAHGRITYPHQQKRRHFRLRRSPGGWLNDVASNGHAIEEDRIEAAGDMYEEYWMMGLRLVKGMPLTPPFFAPDIALPESVFCLDAEWQARFCKEGWLIEEGGYLKASLQGRMRLDYMLGKLLG
jgi:oxygen-independent coproporphyrinogen-3 oxidase